MRVASISDRLKELMNILGISQNDIVVKTNIPKSAISMYISGQRKPRQNRIQDIAEAYGVDEAWLMGYDIPMKKKYDKIIAENIGKFLQDNDRRFFELVDIYSRLDEEGKEAYLTVGRKMLKYK